MHKSIKKINHKINLLLIDGNQFKHFKKLNHKCVVKGDAKYMSIASASILAKTHRDDYMKKIHDDFPFYNWKKNKGYPTMEHKLKIKKFGLSKYHRLTFKST